MSLAEMDPGVHDACSIRKELSADDAARLEAQMREKAWRDEMDRLDGAIAKGRKEGIEEGRNQKETEIITNMFSKGVPITQIADLLNLEVSSVKKILQIQ